MKQQKTDKANPARKFMHRLGLSSKAKKAEKTAASSGKSHRRLFGFINFVFMLGICGVLLAALAVHSIKALYERPGPMPESAALLVPAGSGVSAIAALLQERGFIRNAQVFIFGVYFEDKAKLLKAGEYEIPARASMQKIADILISGRVVQHILTLPEGMTVAQIFAKLKNEPLLSGNLPENLPPEGSLLTDTVKFTRGMARREIVRRLSIGQAHLVQEIWAKRAADLPLQNAGQMVILASIIEKETGLAAERPRVAAVFYNRLKKKMRLQSDPTVLYGLFGSAGKPANRPIYRSDLEKETPYNTYKNFGLPPAPICNPGRESLLAAANPPASDDLYFVADGTGGHIFAKTLTEHNNNVSKWRAWRKAQENTEKGGGEAAGAEEKTGASAAGAQQRRETPAKAENNKTLPPSMLPYAPLLQKAEPLGRSGGLIQETQ